MTPQSPTDLLAPSGLDQLAGEATADELTPGDLLVIAVRPSADDRRVVATPGYGAVRAAISVAVAAGNTRPWSEADGDDIIAIQVSSLPEIIRSSVEPCAVHTIDVGVVRVDGEVAALTMWLSTSVTMSQLAVARHTALLSKLRIAAAADAARSAERARLEAARIAARAAETADRSASRVDVVGGDVLASLPDLAHFRMTLSDVTADEAGVLVFGLDATADLEGSIGADGVHQARQVVAARLLASVRKHDLVARVDDDTFVVVLVNVDRHTAFDISRRLRGTLSQPLSAEFGETVLSISVGLSHESGLIDPDDMYEAATSAMHDAREEGGARMSIAC